ncbi:MAG TPA: PQQ-binding-like beta-propeller repeat protein, partial [Isosphaeraceae bacterium]|nr:PQQ-binding-like beta-propeller repeat protein [Isosphaeraceae bacterium]
ISVFAVAAFLVSNLVLAAEPPAPVMGSDKGVIAVVEPNGQVSWEYRNNFQAHDLQVLENGNILLPLGPARIAEVTRDKKVVWSYESKKTDENTQRVEVHAFQRLPNGNTMIAESGNRRIVEVDRDGKIVHQIALVVEHPNPHSDTRMARKLDNGHYLVCHESDGKVREYDHDGRVVWTYTLDLAGRPRTPTHRGHGTEVFGALRLENGHTLIATGNGNRVIEVTPEGKTVWSIEHDELPGIELFWVTSLRVRPNGNLIVGNCHAGPENPQLFEVTRDKKIVWTFRDFKTFGNDLAIARLLDDGKE